VTVVYFLGRDGRWYWRLYGRNNRIRADGSERYSSRAAVRRAFVGLHARLLSGPLRERVA
jgi:hypothetical protein